MSAPFSNASTTTTTTTLAALYEAECVRRGIVLSRTVHKALSPYVTEAPTGDQPIASAAPVPLTGAAARPSSAAVAVVGPAAKARRAARVVTMEKLDCNSHRLGESGFTPLLVPLALCSRLRELHLADNGLTNSTIAEMLPVLEGLSCLEMLDLRLNPISQSGGRALLRFVCTPRRRPMSSEGGSRPPSRRPASVQTSRVVGGGANGAFALRAGTSSDLMAPQPLTVTHSAPVEPEPAAPAVAPVPAAAASGPSVRVRLEGTLINRALIRMIEAGSAAATTTAAIAQASSATARVLTAHARWRSDVAGARVAAEPVEGELAWDAAHHGPHRFATAAGKQVFAPSGDGGSPGPREKSLHASTTSSGVAVEEAPADVMEIADAEEPAEAVTAIVLVLPATSAAATPEVVPQTPARLDTSRVAAANAATGRGATFHEQCRARVCAALAAAAAETMPPRQGDVFPPARYPALVLLQDGRRLRTQSRRSTTDRFPTVHRLYRIAVQAESPAGWRSSVPPPAAVGPVESTGDVRWAALRLLMEAASVSSQRRAAMRSNGSALAPSHPRAERNVTAPAPPLPLPSVHSSTASMSAVEREFPDLAVAAADAPTVPDRKGLHLLMLAAATPVVAAV